MTGLHVPGKTDVTGALIIAHLVHAHGVKGPGEHGTWSDGIRPYHAIEHQQMHETWPGVAWRPATSDQMLFQHPIGYLDSEAPPLTSRWCYGGQNGQSYPWAQCRYCKRAQAHDCKPVNCLLCGSRQCQGNAECRICFKGYLPGFWRPNGRDTCGYKGCGKPAVCVAPRVHQACLGCAVDRVKVRAYSETGGARQVPLTEYVEKCLAGRDAGKGWQEWRWVL